MNWRNLETAAVTTLGRAFTHRGARILESNFVGRFTSKLRKSARVIPGTAYLRTPAQRIAWSLKRLITAAAQKLVGGNSSAISFELAPAWDLHLLTSHAAPGHLSDAQRAVFAWLVEYKPYLVAAERTWNVDRRAIAGAIAWEALQNPNCLTLLLAGCGRSVGPGKVHYKSKRFLGEGRPVAKQIELAGYLPPQNVASRKRILRTPEGAIAYIAAIMSAYADIGNQCGIRELRTRQDLILVQPYQGVRRVGELDELESWRLAMKRHSERGTRLAPDNPMYHWVNECSNIAFIESAIGTRDMAAMKSDYRNSERVRNAPITSTSVGSPGPNAAEVYGSGSPQDCSKTAHETRFESRSPQGKTDSTCAFGRTI